MSSCSAELLDVSDYSVQALRFDPTDTANKLRHHSHSSLCRRVCLRPTNHPGRGVAKEGNNHVLPHHIVSPHKSSSIRGTMRRQPTTLVSATHDSCGKVRQNVIADATKLAPPCLLEEGLYILCRNRRLHLTAAARDRMSSVAQVYHRVEMDSSVTNHQASQQESMGCAHDSRLSWLRLYEAAAAGHIRTRELYFPAHPRAEPWDAVFDHFGSDSDSDLEEIPASTHIYAWPVSTNTTTITTPPLLCAKGCPAGVVGFLRQAWKKLLDRKGGACDVGTSHDDDWDDADVPITAAPPARNTTTNAGALNQNKKRPRPDHDVCDADFDLFDDVIEEEFPRVKKAMRDRQLVESRRAA